MKFRMNFNSYIIRGIKYFWIKNQTPCPKLKFNREATISVGIDTYSNEIKKTNLKNVPNFVKN